MSEGYFLLLLIELACITANFHKFPDKPFRIARNDTDIVVIPNRFVDELRSKPEHEVSAIEAHMKVTLQMIKRACLL